ncbi:MAG: 3'-5' exonuclease, partial [Ectothiorhodospiraceae bacterium]
LEPLSADAGADQRWATALEVVAAGSEDADGDTPRITLCTVHAAKGLEWPLVHLFGFSEGLMPMARDGEIGNLAEERRLAYVALTRACNNVVLHHADRLDLGTGDGAEALEVSRFLDEIRRGHNVEWMDRRPGAVSPADTEGKDSPRDWLSEMRKALT